jgi:hypothetical protein
MTNKIKELGEDTMLGMSIKTLIALVAGLSFAIAGYYNLMQEIQLAKELPPPVVSRVEFDLKDELVRNAVMETQKQVEQIGADLKRIEQRLYEIK